MSVISLDNAVSNVLISKDHLNAYVMMGTDLMEICEPAVLQVRPFFWQISIFKCQMQIDKEFSFV